jgi:exopolyphosphatase/guanosine-5'-triphosphate,3'-diphosphate pyrophosphatase
VLKGAWSLDIGVVHLTEGFLKSDPPCSNELKAISDAIDLSIKSLKRMMANDGFGADDYAKAGGASFVGTAGTITTLAALDQDLSSYDPERINNYTLKKTDIIRLHKHLSGLSLSQRKEVLTLEKGREDLIIPGSLVCIRVMEAFGFDELVASDAGLLEGILIDMATKGLN